MSDVAFALLGLETGIFDRTTESISLRAELLEVKSYILELEGRILDARVRLPRAVTPM